MAEYIDRAAAVKVILRERKPTNSVAQNRMLSIIQRDLLTMCAADVAPVVRCKDCENSYYVVDGLIAGELNHAAQCVAEGYVTWADIRQMLKEYGVETALE